jgi:hypothetical protein
MHTTTTTSAPAATLPAAPAGAMLVTDFVDKVLHPVMDEIRVTGPVEGAAPGRT